MASTNPPPYNRMNAGFTNPAIPLEHVGTSNGQRNGEQNATNQMEQQDQTESISIKVEGMMLFGREFVGTAIYVFLAFLGINSVFTQGFAYAFLLASCQISSAGGLHLNPAISIAVVISGKMKKPVLVFPMILGQFFGCLLGAAMARGVLNEEEYLKIDNYRSTHTAYDIYTVLENEMLYKRCFGEFILTLIMVNVYLKLFPLESNTVPTTRTELMAAQTKKYIQALFVGFTVFVGNSVMLRATHIGVMNPLIVFGPQIVMYFDIERDRLSRSPLATNDQLIKEILWRGHAVLWIGPIVAGVFAGMIARAEKYLASQSGRRTSA